MPVPGAPGRAGRGRGSGSWPSLASARLTADTVSCCVGGAAMLCPISETAARLPPVAATTPSSQAPAASRTRVCTMAMIADRTLRGGKASHKRRVAGQTR